MSQAVIESARRIREPMIGVAESRRWVYDLKAFLDDIHQDLLRLIVKGIENKIDELLLQGFKGKERSQCVDQ